MYTKIFIDCVQMYGALIWLFQVSTVPWEWSPRPQVPHTAALLPSITSVPPTTPTTPTTSTSLAQPPTALTSHHTSTLRNSTSTGTTTTPGYQVGRTAECWWRSTRIVLSGAYKRLDNEMLSNYYDRDRSKSKSPKPMFYKSPSPQRSRWGGYY